VKIGLLVRIWAEVGVLKSEELEAFRVSWEGVDCVELLVRGNRWSSELWSALVGRLSAGNWGKQSVVMRSGTPSLLPPKYIPGMTQLLAIPFAFRTVPGMKLSTGVA
jgi:hypothetical protein